MMLRSIVIGLGSLCVIALVVLGVQNWHRLPSVSSLLGTSDHEETATKSELQKLDAQLKQSISSNQKTIQALRQENATLTGRLEKLSASLSKDHNSRLDDLEAEIAALQAKLNRQSTPSSTLRRPLPSSTTTSTLHPEIATLQQSIDALRNDTENHSHGDLSQMSDLRKEFDQLTKVVAQLSADVSKLQSANARTNGTQTAPNNAQNSSSSPQPVIDILAFGPDQVSGIDCHANGSQTICRMKIKIVGKYRDFVLSGKSSITSSRQHLTISSISMLGRTYAYSRPSKRFRAKTAELPLNLWIEMTLVFNGVAEGEKQMTLLGVNNARMQTRLL